MNKLELMGRLTKDVELKKGKNDKEYAVFTLAIPRKENKEITDFVDCVAFGKLAEALQKYTEKGNRLIVTGSIHFDKYQDKDGNNKTSIFDKYQDKDGNNKTSINVIVDDFFFVDFKAIKKDNKQEDIDIPNELPF